MSAYTQWLLESALHSDMCLCIPHDFQKQLKRCWGWQLKAVTIQYTLEGMTELAKSFWKPFPCRLLPSCWKCHLSSSSPLSPTSLTESMGVNTKDSWWRNTENLQGIGGDWISYMSWCVTKVNNKRFIQSSVQRIRDVQMKNSMQLKMEKQSVLTAISIHSVFTSRDRLWC